jgi:hypothetical protein
MKALIVLIILVCAAAALWYFRDEIRGEKLAFESRDEAGARFKAPNWRESASDANPTEGRLILKHKRNDARIFYLAWQYATEPANGTECGAAAKEFARVLGTMTGSRVSVEPAASGFQPAASGVEIAGQQTRAYTLSFEKKGVGPGELLMWHFAPNKQRWYFAIVDDDADERARIAREFLGSFKPGRSTVEHTAPTEGKLRFDAPLGWGVFEETPMQVLYTSPQEEVLLQLNHGVRTSQTRMTKAYAASLADQLLAPIGGTWQSREIALAQDARLNTVVARVHGVALIEYTEQHYELRLWISPTTKLLYIAALSAENKKAVEKFLGIFDHVSSEE